jgi:hypothetical protein
MDLFNMDEFLNSIKKDQLSLADSPHYQIFILYGVNVHNKILYLKKLKEEGKNITEEFQDVKKGYTDLLKKFLGEGFQLNGTFSTKNKRMGRTK